MKPPRQFRPLAPVALEDRIALSGVSAAHAVSASASARAGTSAQVQTTSGSTPTFALNIAGTIAAGLPVYEQTTVRYNDGSTQTGTTLIIPNNTNSSTETTSVLNLRNNGGTETVDDFSYLAVTGNTVKVTTTYLPDGSIQTTNQTFQAQGNTTLIAGAIKDDTGVSSISGSTTVRGRVTITDKTVTGPTGQVSKDHIVTVQHGELKQTVTDTQTLPSGKRQVTRSTETIVRLALPKNLVQAPGASATPPTIA